MGISGMDAAVKHSDVKLMIADTVCPGKFLLVFAGKHAAVTASVEQLRLRFTGDIIRSLVIGNLSEGILEDAAPDAQGGQAVGVVETSDAVSAILAADEAIKTAHVRLFRLKLANGVGGKGAALIVGGISEVFAAVERAAQSARLSGSLVAKTVVTNPTIETVSRLAEM